MSIRFLLAMLFTSTLVQAQVPRVIAGTLQRHAAFPSEFVKPRNIDVLLPENYDTRKKYPVLYLHDGQNLFDSSLTFNKQEWGVDETLQQLLTEKRIVPVIVVGIWNTADRRLEYFPEKVFNQLSKPLQDSLLKDFGQPAGKLLSDHYLKFIVEELKPFIDKTYSTLQGPANTFVAGSSMGGLISMYAVCEYPDIFGAAACLSTHWPGSIVRNDPAVGDAFMQYMNGQLPAPKKHLFYFDYGTATLDAWYEPYQWKIDAVMRGRKYTPERWMTRKFEGAAHDENAWRSRLAIPFGFILPKAEAPKR